MLCKNEGPEGYLGLPLLAGGEGSEAAAAPGSPRALLGLCPLGQPRIGAGARLGLPEHPRAGILGRPGQKEGLQAGPEPWPHHSSGGEPEAMPPGTGPCA